MARCSPPTTTLSRAILKDSEAVDARGIHFVFATEIKYIMSDVGQIRDSILKSVFT